MTDIIIRAHNQLNAKILCEPSTAFEITEKFSFFAKGYKFMPQFKKGFWDGKIRLFNTRARELPRGLIPMLFEWAEDNGYTIDFEDEEDFNSKIETDLNWLNDWGKYGKLPPREHQVRAINHVIKNKQNLLLSPTGSGKSYIIYMLVRYFLEKMDGKILITVPTTSLVEQLTSDFKDYAVNWDVDNNVHKIYSGKEKSTDARVVISTWQSIYKQPPQWFKQFTGYMCDEAHGADSKSITAIVNNLAHADLRLGLTGTLNGTTLHELEMLARFGSLFRSTTTKALMETGELANLEIECYRLKYTKEEAKLVKYMSYQQEIDFLVQHRVRNNVLVNTALRSKNNTLMLFNFIDRHGSILFEMLKAKAEKYNKKIYYISGKTAVEDREKIRKILELENDAILLASMGTMSTGVNVKNLHNVIFCHPYKAQIKTLQSIGRTIRQSAGKNCAKLFDLIDDLSVKRGQSEKINTTLKHAIERLKIYSSEGFPYKIIDLNLE